MIKLITILLIVFTFMACTDNGVSAESEYNYTQPKTYSSSSVRYTPVSSSQTIIVLPPSSSSQIIQRPSSSSKAITLEEVCDMAAANVINSTNIGSKEQVCADYKVYLKNIVEMTNSDLNYCMQYETCNEIQTTELPACNMSSYDAGYSSDYLKSLCGKYKAQGYSNFQNCDCSKVTETSNRASTSKCNTTCRDSIQAVATKNGVGRSTGTQNAIKMYCGC